MYFDTLETKGFEFVVISDEQGLKRVSLASTFALPSGVKKDKSINKPAVEQLRAYFEGDLKEFNLKLSPDGTTFQKAVWNELGKIPYGSTSTYGQIAEAIKNPKASRAVGLANNKNPIPIIIPCHRVVGKNGALTGYAYGLEMKEFLLKLEAAL